MLAESLLAREVSPASLAESLVATAEAVGAGTGGAQRWGHAERTAMLRAIDRAAAILTASRGRVLRAEDAAGTWSAKGDPSIARWDGRVSRTGRSGGVRREREALTWGTLDRLAGAAEAGRVSAEHVAAAGRAMSSLSDPARAAMAAPDVQQELLAAAVLQDATTFGRTAARLAARLEPDSMEAGLEAQQAGRFLTLSDRADGTHVAGRLDRLSGHTLRLALEALSPRPAEDDGRSVDQRRADALTTMATGVLADPRTTPGAAVPPHVSVILTEETWAGLRAWGLGRKDGRRQPPPERTPGEVVRPFAGLAPVEPATLEDGTPLPHSQLARTLCDCELTRVVVDAAGTVLDLGRTVRLYSGAHRRAVLARDRGCSWEGCGAQARWCEIHHIRWWDRDTGPSSIENAVALCRYHHSVVHQLDLTITRTPRAGGAPDSGMPLVGYRFTDPDGRTVSPRGSPPGIPPDGAAPARNPRAEDSAEFSRSSRPESAAGPYRTSPAGTAAEPYRTSRAEASADPSRNPRA